MNFIFFDQNDKVVFSRSDAITAHYIHEELKHTATFPDVPSKQIQRGMRVGWLDRNKNLILCEIRLPVRSLPNGTVSYTAEHICISELRDKVVQDKRSYDVSAYMALNSVLENTGWSIGKYSYNPSGSSNFYWIDAWESVCKIKEAWNVYIRPRITFDGTQITGRYLDILDPNGTFYGVRLQLDRNVEYAGVTYDDRNLCTALYGRGKGEIVGTNEDGQDAYGRRITFKDAVWRRSAGDPVDKPAGQLFVEDPAATALYGRKGIRREAVVEFPECESPGELLQLTWEELQRRVVPNVTIDMTVINLHALGYQGQALDLCDVAAVVIKPWDYRTMLKVVQLDEDLLAPENTRPVMGTYRANIVQRTNHTIKDAAVGQQIAQSTPSILKGYIDTAVTVIMSSKTRRATLPDGSEIYTSEDGRTAVRFTGAGILLSSEKDATGDFIWRTALTGEGLTADEITTGVLNAAAVKILGTNRFFWDAENICAINPENSNQQIRFGLYDGEHYGIGFTKDGGQTWQNAIGFNGINVSATGYTKSFVQLDQPVAENVGDLWAQTDPRNWKELKSFKWRNLSPETWDAAAGYPVPKVYVWDGAAWILEADGRFITRIAAAESSIEQNRKMITSKVSQTTYDLDKQTMEERVTNSETQIKQQATEISQRVKTGDFEAYQEQTAKDITATFNEIGLDGAQTGITKVDKDGVKVTHSRIGGYTQMSADGFKLVDSEGKVLGGMYNEDGEAVSSVQQLYNPDTPGFKADIGATLSYGEGAGGVQLNLQGKKGGFVGVYGNGDGPQGMLVETDGNLVMLPRGNVNLEASGAVEVKSGKGVRTSVNGKLYVGEVEESELYLGSISAQTGECAMESFGDVTWDCYGGQIKLNADDVIFEIDYKTPNGTQTHGEFSLSWLYSKLLEIMPPDA